MRKGDDARLTGCLVGQAVMVERQHSLNMLTRRSSNVRSKHRLISRFSHTKVFQSVYPWQQIITSSNQARKLQVASVRRISMEVNREVFEFNHEPLPDSTSHIRLLEILSADSGGDVTCHLSTWIASSTPSYHALSYTWGDPALTESVIINGKSSKVRANCKFALQQAYASKASRYFWLDAICIDQSSMEEKNHQVAMMNQIYQRAAHVLACIGNHTDSSKFLFEMFDKQQALLASINSHITKLDLGNLKEWAIPNPIPTTRWLALRCFFSIKAEARKQLAEAMIDLLQRPYFSRVWIMQELHLACGISLCCGLDIRYFKNILAVSMLVDFWINQLEHLANWNPITRSSVALLFRQTRILRRQNSCDGMQQKFSILQPRRGCLALATGARGPRRLAEVLDAMQHFQCTDIRDKLYGILSLVDWHGGPAIVPDYNLSSFEIAIKVLGIYQDYEGRAPLFGSLLDWARCLCETFQLSLEDEGMRDAIQFRYGDAPIPYILYPGHGELKSRTGVGSKSTDQLSVFRKSRLVGRTSNTWYGTRLLRDADSNPGLGHGHLWRASIGLVTEVRDHNSDLFAYAPEGTRVDDWILRTSGHLTSKKNPIALVVRLSDTDTGRYTIIGQAVLLQAQDDIFQSMHRERFPPRWDPEDIFLLDWSYNNRHACEPSLENIASWLRLRVITNRKLTSYFFGPSHPSLRPSYYYNLGVGVERHTLRNPNWRLEPLYDLEPMPLLADSELDAENSSEGEW